MAERKAGGAAVIGAGGFLGSALRRALDDLGVPVAGFTRETPFLDERGALDERVRSADTVYWLASSIRPATMDGGGEADRRALTSLVDALREQRATPPRLVAASSGGTVYEPTAPSPHAEDTPLHAANAYGEAMLQIEQLVSSTPDPVILRVANAYGPGQPARRGQGVIAYWLSAIAAGEPIHILGSDEVARDYVYIDDVAAALVRVHQAPQPPAVVNIGSGEPTTLRALAELVVEAVAPAAVTVRHDAGRNFDAPSTWLDVSRAAKTLEWEPEVVLTEGLRRTWAWVRARRGSGPTLT